MSKSKKNIIIFLLKIGIFTAVKYRSILHERVNEIKITLREHLGTNKTFREDQITKIVFVSVIAISSFIKSDLVAIF